MTFRKQISKAFTICCVLTLIGCASEGGVFDADNYDHIDRDQELNRDDYENMTAPRHDADLDAVTAERSSKIPPVPEVAQILAAPKPPKIGKTKLVSVSVTDDVPLKDVLLELARLADVDIELGSGIEGGISFSANNKPFNEVIERISDLAGLRYKFTNGVLRIERDLPYMKNYSLDFLNLIRNSESNVSITTDVLSASIGSGESGDGLSTGSSSTITSESESDFWSSLESNINEILNTTPFGPEDQAGDATAVITGAPAAGEEGADVVEEGTTSAGRGRNGAFYVVNRQAGILSVSATERQHAMLKEYLAYLERNASAQVLIEAKIVEVELEKGFQSGVNWTSVIGNSDFAINFPTSITNGATYTVLGPGKSSTGVGAANPTGDNNLGIDLDAVVQLTERFGTSRTLSSPRLHAINNQQAVLTFAENRIFFEVDVTQEQDQVVDGNVIPGTTSVDSTRRSIPIGIILNIMPSINLDRNEVTLNVRPTLSRQVDSVEDPGSAFLASLIDDANFQFSNTVPVVEVRELDSVMKLKSGSVMVIGGLMEEVAENDDEGLPLVSEVPWLGNAFKSTSKASSKRELIIFIKATIVSPSGSYQPADRTVYEKFTDDPRPLAF